VAMGADVARAVRGLPILSGSGGPAGSTVRIGPPAVAEAGPRRLQIEAQGRVLAEGKTLSKEEVEKKLQEMLQPPLPFGIPK